MSERDDVDVTPLQQLIVDVSDKGVTLETMSRRCGGRLNRSYFGQLKNHPIKGPLPRSTVEAIADGLRLPYSVVRDAMLASVGLAEYRSKDELDIITADVRERLSPSQVKAWQAQARALLDLLAGNDKPST